MSKKHEEERSLTTTEIAKLFVQGWIAGLEQETPPPEQERARLEKHLNEEECKMSTTLENRSNK